jgi:hypothetical protein
MHLHRVCTFVCHLHRRHNRARSARNPKAKHGDGKKGTQSDEACMIAWMEMSNPIMEEQRRLWHANTVPDEWLQVRTALPTCPATCMDRTTLACALTLPHSSSPTFDAGTSDRGRDCQGPDPCGQHGDIQAHHRDHHQEADDWATIIPTHL